MAAQRTPLYRHFLTPSLHRRFTSAAVIILTVSYVEAVLVGEKTSRTHANHPEPSPSLSNAFVVLWSWFPIGPAGIRALLLFISALSIFVLRVAQIHIGMIAYVEQASTVLKPTIGARTTASPFETVTRYLIRLNTVQTLAWYFFSAWWFSEVYMWSVPSSADLNWISEGK